MQFDCIDLQALKDLLKQEGMEEVIHCKDCIYSSTKDNDRFCDIKFHWNRRKMLVPDNGYCHEAMTQKEYEDSLTLF